MQITGQFRDFFYDTMLPALDATIRSEFKAKPRLFDKLLQTDSTSIGIKQYSQLTGVGLFRQINEAEDIGTDNQLQGFDKTLKTVKYGLGISCSEELVRHDKFGVAKRRAQALAVSCNQTIEIQAATLFNNAFTTAGADGVALCASNHPLVKAGTTQSNILSVAADLDVSSLEQALTDWALIKTAEGFYQYAPTPRLLVAPQNWWNAVEILKSQMRSDTANNTENAFKYGENGGPAVQGPVQWSYLTDPDAWFLVAQPSETGLVWLWDRKPYTKSDYTEKNETGHVYMRYWATCGFYDWRGVYGTAGA